MLDKIKQLEKKIKEEIFSVQQSIDLLAIEKKYLARQKGELAQLIKRIGKLSNEEKPIAGQAFNQLKQKINQWLKQRQQELECQSTKDNSTAIDITLPGKKYLLGYLHPLTRVRQQVSDIFTSMGWQVLEGKEVETDYYNFTALNIPFDHPARDMWDTFYLKKDNLQFDPQLIKETTKNEKLLLRTHTSPMQIRVMKSQTPPLKTVVIGKCFRHEATDAGHEHTFYQIEGLVVDQQISLSNLIHTLQDFLKDFFQQEIKFRLRPEYFPFVEPGLEMDISCFNCHGKGCSVCEQTGWIEALGCGMIHPRVFQEVGYPANKYTGFAFGIGLDRLAMIKYKINDIRWFHRGDLRFNQQF